MPRDIKPEVNGQSDFFSWQLYRWRKKNPERMQVFAGTWNTISGHDPKNPVFYIGKKVRDDWFHGRVLRNLCSHGSGLQSWAYGPAHHVSEWVDVTDVFWERYFRMGVCAIHGDYAHKWNEGCGTRVCEYCGKVERRKVEMIERVYWEGDE